MTKKLNVKVFSDGAVLETMLKDLQTGLVTGFTTNPSLMKKSRHQFLYWLCQRSACQNYRLPSVL